MSKEYDFVAAIYDPFLYFALKPVRNEVLLQLQQYKDKMILDLCGGTGSQLKLLAKNGFNNLHCLDLSTAMLRIAAKGKHDIHIYKDDATATGFENNSVAVIIISLAIHEKDGATQQEMLHEAFRILKPGGVLLIADFDFDNNTYWFSRLAVRAVERMAGGEHYRNFKNYIKNNGLPGLVDKKMFKLVGSKKKLFGAVAVLKFVKV